MLSKLKHDAAQPQAQQPPRKKQRTANEHSSNHLQHTLLQNNNNSNHPFPKQKVTTIYLACPPNVQTGGPEAMHQLCHKINSVGNDHNNQTSSKVTAYILYVKEQSKHKNHAQHVPHATPLRAYESTYSDLKVATSFPMFDENVNYEESNDGNENDPVSLYNNSLIIWPECWTHLIDSFQPSENDDSTLHGRRKRFQTAIWWLSVNNNNSKFKDWKRKDILHLHQSEYAKCYVSDNIRKQNDINPEASEMMSQQDAKLSSADDKKGDSKSTSSSNDTMLDNIIPMTEFIPHDRYCDHISSSVQRTLQIVYNPFKGVHYTDSIIKRSSAKFTFTPIGSIEKRISPSDVTKMLNSAKVYIDFGPHPGMDRLPREAALCGCIVITNMQGAAFYNDDVPIPAEYKVKDFDVDLIHRLLTSCIDNFDKKEKDFDSYRNWIRSQESKMDSCVTDLVSRISLKR